MKHLILSLLLLLTGMFFALPASGIDGISSEVQAQTRVKITGNGVRLRYGPGQGYDIYCQLNKGATCAYYETCGDWYKVGYNGMTLYVSRDFSSLYNTSSGSSTHSSSSSSYTSSGYPYVVVHAKNLRIRTGPSTSYPYLVWNSTGKTVHLNHGDKLIYLGEIRNGFYKIKFDGRSCWIACEYATPSY